MIPSTNNRRPVSVGSRPADRPSWLPAPLAGTSAQDDAAQLRRLVPDLLDRDVYVCGPQEWTDATLQALRDAGVADAQVHLERFSW